MARPCHFFRLGTCRNGDQCRFYHEGLSEFSYSPESPEYSDANDFDSDTDDQDEIEERYSDEIVDDAEANDIISRTLFSRNHGNMTTPGIPSATSAPGTPVDHSSRHSAGGHCPSNSSLANADATRTSRYTKPCRWYLAGYCLRGDECWFSHDLSSSSSLSLQNLDSASMFVFSQDNATSSSSSSPPVLTSATPNSHHEEDRKCAICLEIPTTFGLLVSCNHAFCLTCIRTWRSKNISSSTMDAYEDRANSVTKACPNCRTPSLYIVPSSFFPVNQAQKDQIFTSYKQAASKRPCKYFEQSGTRQWCPFGDDCFFAHLDANGEACKVNPSSNPRLRRLRRHIDNIELRRNNIFLQDLVEFFDEMGFAGFSPGRRHQRHHSQTGYAHDFVYTMDDDGAYFISDSEEDDDLFLDAYGEDMDEEEDEDEDDDEEDEYDEHGWLPSEYRAFGVHS
ncbi:hypothetical protein BG004_005120 [Podila humilis]|nr:hypothetical protein BG004_005120 [Podila humilis]